MLEKDIKAGYSGSPAVLTSSINEELVEKGFFYQEFTFFNYEECTISINDSNPIYLAPGQGFIVNPNGKLVESFVICEANITFNWVGVIKYVTIHK